MENLNKIEEFVGASNNSRNGAGSCKQHEGSIYENNGYGYGHVNDSLRHKGTGRIGSLGGEARGSDRHLCKIFK